MYSLYDKPLYYLYAFVAFVVQLPPIIKGVYPQHQYGDIKYNGSVLECLLRQISHEQRIRPFEVQMAVSGDSVNVAQPLCTKLLENNRMNHSLAHFTQFTYGADYICCC
jgi:hypothetical protein